MSTISQQATGRWPGILQALGIAESFLKNQHGPCPLCGGKDRFRFDNKGGKGTFYCNTCGSGDGFVLLQKANNWTFSQTAREVERILGTCPTQTQAKNDCDAGKNEARLKRINAGLRKITHDGIAGKYLLSRGITILPVHDCYFHPGIDYYHRNDAGNPIKIGTYPAMVSIFRNVWGKTCTYHVTFLTPDGQKLSQYPAKKFLPTILPMTGGAIRLGGIAEHISVAEGIETSLAGMQDTGIPCWAAGNARNLENIQVPELVKRVTIYADEDTSFTGQKSAYVLANRLKVQCGLDVEVIRLLGRDGPVFRDTGIGADYCDYINGTRLA